MHTIIEEAAHHAEVLTGKQEISFQHSVHDPEGSGTLFALKPVIQFLTEFGQHADSSLLFQVFGHYKTAARHGLPAARNVDAVVQGDRLPMLQDTQNRRVPRRVFAKIQARRGINGCCFCGRDYIRNISGEDGFLPPCHISRWPRQSPARWLHTGRWDCTEPA